MKDKKGSDITTLENSFAFLLISVYILRLIFTFKTQKHLFVSEEVETTTKDNEKLEKNTDLIPIFDTITSTAENNSKNSKNLWSKKKAIDLLGLSMIGVAIVSEVLVGSVKETISRYN